MKVQPLQQCFPNLSMHQNHLAAAAAKSLQSGPTFHDPMDCSLPGSSVPRDSPGKSTGVGCHALSVLHHRSLGLAPSRSKVDSIVLTSSQVMPRMVFRTPLREPLPEGCRSHACKRQH